MIESKYMNFSAEVRLNFITITLLPLVRHGMTNRDTKRGEVATITTVPKHIAKAYKKVLKAEALLWEVRYLIDKERGEAYD